MGLRVLAQSGLFGSRCHGRHRLPVSPSSHGGHGLHKCMQKPAFGAMHENTSYFPISLFIFF